MKQKLYSNIAISYLIDYCFSSADKLFVIKDLSLYFTILNPSRCPLTL